MVREVVLVAIDASMITGYALEWAVRNVIRPADLLVLLAILPSLNYNHPPASRNHQARGRQSTKGFFSRLVKKRSNVGRNDLLGFVDDGHDVPQRIYSVCAQMIQQLFDGHKVSKVATEVKVIAYAPMGSVSMAAAELGAKWVILDRRLKKEGDCCLKQFLNCNVILIDHAIPKILRSVNFTTAMKYDQERIPRDPTEPDTLEVLPAYNPAYNNVTTPITLGSDGLSSNTRDTPSSFMSTSSSSTKDNFLTPISNLAPADISANSRGSISYSKSQQLNKVSEFGITASHKSIALPAEEKTQRSEGVSTIRHDTATKVLAKTTLMTPIPESRPVDSRNMGQNPRDENEPRKRITRRVSVTMKRFQAPANNSTLPLDRTSSLRRDISLSIKRPPAPPPLCSVCKQKAPVLGKSPRRFSHEEIERATDGFSSKNFLAEGGYGKVYRGILADGQVVAVKQHKILSAQGASEFCSEVEVLSCAQHKNLVMLIGYSIDVEWLLVYEFACNGSLDEHLYGKDRNEVMAWHNRMKVAIGAARGLRYLHEDCRVGCIVHRDFRPNNVLLTHDFEPMVGDFGLARWQVDGQAEEETRVVGAFGYLAPDYTQTGLITEKADVYAFGVVLLELLTGIKAIEFSRNTRRQYFPDGGRQFLERKVSEEMIDCRLENNYIVKEVECMMHAATLCISPDPEQRPRMSKVLRILEGDLPTEMPPHQEPSTSITPKPNLDTYNRERFWKQKQDSSTYQKQILPQMNLRTSTQNPPQRETHRNSMFKQAKSSGDLHKVVNDDRDSHKHDKVVRDEYQEYLQGSLTKYIQSLTVK